jgi:hypothetical protein
MQIGRDAVTARNSGEAHACLPSRLRKMFGC